MIKFIFLIMWFICVASAIEDDIGNNEHRRKSRFFSFNTRDDDITVQIDFSVPFISIPVKKSLEATLGSNNIFSSFPTINFNVGAIALAGAMVIGTTFLLPFLMKTSRRQEQRTPFARFIESSEFELEPILNGLHYFMQNTSELQACAQRIACWSAKNMSAMMSKDTSTRTAKTLIGILSNPLLKTMLNGTFMAEPLKAASKGKNCAKTYADCNLTQETVRNFMVNFY